MRVWLSTLIVAVVAGAVMPALATEPATRTDKIKFHQEDGHTAFSLKLKDNGAKLVDGDEQELARFTVSQQKMKIKDAADKALGSIGIAEDRLKLESPDGKVICILRRQADGDWKVEDSQDKRLATIKRRDYGAELEDAEKKSLFKAKVKGRKASLRNPADHTVYSTNEKVSAEALSCLGLDVISDIRLRAGLLFAMDHARPAEQKSGQKPAGTTN